MGKRINELEEFKKAGVKIGLLRMKP